MSKIRELCRKSKLRLVEEAYVDLTEWEDNPSDQRFIDEIEWKLNCAEEDDDGEYTKRDFSSTRKFLLKLKEELYL